VGGALKFVGDVNLEENTTLSWDQPTPVLYPPSRSFRTTDSNTRFEKGFSRISASSHADITSGSPLCA
jgi:hypothetical protein